MKQSPVQRALTTVRFVREIRDPEKWRSEKPVDDLLTEGEPCATMPALPDPLWEENGYVLCLHGRKQYQE